MIANFGRRLHKLTQMIEHPQLWGLHRKGVATELYPVLCRPWITEMGIRTVLDIGANTGQFARLMHAILPATRIYSFEPLPECFAELAKCEAEIPMFKAFNVGLGSEAAELTFYKSALAVSSSFRPMTSLHRTQFPLSAGPEHKLRIPIRALDSFADELHLQEQILVKIDVQGFEDQVIAGGKAVLERASMIILEVSFAPLYENSPSFNSLYTMLRELGFEFRGMLDSLIGPVDGSILSADALFIKPTEG